MFETMHHLVQADVGFLRGLAPELISANWDPYLEKTAESVRARASEVARLWLEYASRDPDASEMWRRVWPDVTHEFPAAMEMAQALFHSAKRL